MNGVTVTNDFGLFMVIDLSLNSGWKDDIVKIIDKIDLHNGYYRGLIVGYKHYDLIDVCSGRINAKVKLFDRNLFGSFSKSHKRKR